MNEKISSLDFDIISCLNANYGIEIRDFQKLSLGADINAFVYKAIAKDNHSYFIKLKKDWAYDFSLILLSHLMKVGIKNIIFPIQTKKRALCCHINKFTLIVYPFIEGQDGFSVSLSDNQWITLGKVLKQVHDFKAPIHLLPKLRKENFSNHSRTIVPFIFKQIEQEIKGDVWAIKLIEFIKKHESTIQHIVDRAEILCQKIKKQPLEFVLCHADIHAGNVILSNDNKIYIIDWDNPIMAPKERDLMFIGGGIANVWNNLHEEKLFFQGYGKTKINKKLLAYYRHQRIVEDIVEYYESLILTIDNDPDREIMYNHFIAMFEPLGVIEIAFKTDEGFE